MRIVVAMSGASGAIYGIRLLESLRALDMEVHLVVSRWGKETIKTETAHEYEQVTRLATHCWENGNLGAPISSGSFKHDGMVIIPCSMKTVAGIAHGLGDNLIVRAADVTIKEKRKLVIVPRETPLSQIHLQNLLTLSQLGATIIPPMPAFYNKPKDLNDIINHLVSRVLDHLGINNELAPRWGG
ncbi:hypothetical protein SY88_16600 [Clostridiales bacterium PH28_bin88]|nr:hypothetical protein SY88_16600 [Clostridiales bacterium PH28_bin88]